MRIMKGRITIKDVAEVAGVSTQTVSRVLNDRPDVSPETRARVKQIIGELGYAPNVLARGLSSGKTTTLGVVGFGLEYFGPANVITGIEKKASECGYSVLLALMDNLDERRVEQVLARFIAQQVVGIIWAIPGFTDSMQRIERATEDLTVPMVLLNRPSLKRKIVVAVDNRTGAKLASHHLIEEGYSHIGIISGPLTWWETQERLAGWREVMLARGVRNLDSWIFEGDWGVESGDCGFEALYAAHLDLDAVFVCNDQMSLGVIQAANRKGLSIPQDLGIVGFDNIPESKFFLPPLTTVDQGARQLGVLAVQRLNECIQAGGNERCIEEGENWIHPELVVRASSRRRFNGAKDSGTRCK